MFPQNYKQYKSEIHQLFNKFIGYPVSVSGMITLPVSSSIYQTMVANIQQLHSNSDGTLCITPMQVQKNHTLGTMITNHNNTNTNTTTTTSATSSSSSSSSSLSTSVGINHILNASSGSSSSSTVKYCRAVITNNSNDTTVKTLGKYNNSRSNNINNNSITSNNSDKYNCLMPKIEHADADHSRAVVDNHGNITIHLGDGEPIKLECEIEA